MTLEELVGKPKPGTFPRRLRALRAYAGLSQIELADKAGLERSTISLLERGRHEPQQGTLEKLARTLGVSVEALTGE